MCLSSSSPTSKKRVVSGIYDLYRKRKRLLVGPLKLFRGALPLPWRVCVVSLHLLTGVGLLADDFNAMIAKADQRVPVQSTGNLPSVPNLGPGGG